MVSPWNLCQTRNLYLRALSGSSNFLPSVDFLVRAVNRRGHGLTAKAFGDLLGGLYACQFFLFSSVFVVAFALTFACLLDNRLLRALGIWMFPARMDSAVLARFRTVSWFVPGIPKAWFRMFPISGDGLSFPLFCPMLMALFHFILVVILEDACLPNLLRLCNVDLHPHLSVSSMLQM